ncbi:MAG: ABC transporter ATP-binding protein [Oscillospiraceae bacterium]|nr:ABC transporter ATP-binding protein [Oscillospiraceae bacterium]
MIEVRELRKSFDGFEALRGLNIHVPKGAVYGLVGPNGAGKSTLIRHLTGIYRGDSGEVLIGGQPVFENPAVKEKLAYIPDDIFYLGAATVRDMKNLYRAMIPTFSDERFEKLREAFPLDEKRAMRRLSKGMQKQAAFWIALSCCPEVLILDEPVDGLDPVMRRQVWSLLLQDVAERGTTVLVSSHNLRELEDVCDHVGILDRGRMLLERPLADLQENTVKIQLALPEGRELPEGLRLLHETRTGRLRQLILRGRAEELTARLSACEPFFMDVLPLSLEEIFIYELGGEDHAIKNILL